MTAFDCAAVRDLGPEFALGVLEAEARSDVVLHLDRCAACRAYVAELSETGDAIAQLAPEAEPPPGFERRVLAGMVAPERRRRWRTVKLVAVAAAAAAILSIVTVRVVDESRSSSEVTAAPVHRTVTMVGANGLRVGAVDVQGAGSARSIALTVEYALPDGAYRIVLDRESGSSESLGIVRVVDGKGGWTGAAPASL